MAAHLKIPGYTVWETLLYRLELIKHMLQLLYYLNKYKSYAKFPWFKVCHKFSSNVEKCVSVKKEWNKEQLDKNLKVISEKWFDCFVANLLKKEKAIFMFLQKFFLLFEKTLISKSLCFWQRLCFTTVLRYIFTPPPEKMG